MTDEYVDFFHHWIGLNVDDVLAEFKQENMYDIIESVPEGTLVTMDLRDRVRIWFDSETNNVTAIIIG